MAKSNVLKVYIYIKHYYSYILKSFRSMLHISFKELQHFILLKIYYIERRIVQIDFYNLETLN